MIKEIVTTLTEGLLQHHISIHALISTFNIELPLSSHLMTLIYRGRKGDAAAIEQFKSVLSVYLVEQHIIDDIEDKNFIHEIREQLLETSKAMAFDEMKDKVASIGDVIPYQAINIPIFAVGAYAWGNKKFKERNKELTANMEALVRQVEYDCQQKHQLYGLVSQTYRERLKNTRSTEEREEILQAWQQAHTHFETYIQKSQQNMAILGAKIQEARSQNRFNSARTAVDIFSAGLNLIGPVGTVLGGVINGANTVIGAGGMLYTSNSAKSNQIVLPGSDIRIEDTSDLLEGLSRVRTVSSASISFESPTITFNGKPVKTEKIPTLKLDMEKYAATVCKQMAKARPPWISCRLPDYEFKRPAEIVRSNNLFETHFDTLHVEQKMLQKAYLWYVTLTRELIAAYPDGNYPIIANLQVITADLQRKSDTIDYQLEQLSELIQPGKASPEVLNKMHLVKAFQNSVHVLQESLQEQMNTMATSSYAQYFENTSSGDKQDPLYMDYVAWRQQDILFQCNSLEKLLIACDKMGGGRELANMPELLQQIQKGMQSIKSGLLTAEISVIEGKIRAILERSLELDRARLDILMDLHQVPDNLLDTATYRQQLIDLQKKLLAYPLTHLTIGNLLERINRALDKISLEESVAALSQLSPLKIDQMTSTHTFVITPSRLEFGFSKRKDQLASVQAVINRLFKEDRNIQNIQILPLQPVTQESWLAARGDEKKLADTVEGLKTEMQWVNLFCSEPIQRQLQTTVDKRISMANLTKLRNYYATQIQFIEAHLAKREEILNDRFERVYASHHSLEAGSLSNRLARLGSWLTNKFRTSSIGRIFLHNAETQLEKCTKQLEELDRIIAAQPVQEDSLPLVSPHSPTYAVPHPDTPSSIDSFVASSSLETTDSFVTTDSIQTQPKIIEQDPDLLLQETIKEFKQYKEKEVEEKKQRNPDLILEDTFNEFKQRIHSVSDVRSDDEEPPAP